MSERGKGVNNWNSKAVEGMEKKWYEKLDGYVGEIFDAVLEVNKGTVVDMGCGFGRFVEFVKRKRVRDLEYLGLDGSMAMIKRFKDLHPEYMDRVSHRNLLRPLPEIHNNSTCLCMAVLIHLTLAEQKKVMNNVLRANPRVLIFDVNYMDDGEEIEKIIDVRGQPFRMTYNDPEKFHKYVRSMFGGNYRVQMINDYKVQKGIWKRAYILTRFRKKVSVIMGTRNETVFLNLTVRSAIEELKAVSGGSEIIVVDNSDPHFWMKESVVDGVKKEVKGPVHGMIPYRYIKQGVVKLIRQEEPCFTAARMEAAREATGEYLFCVDSHVLFGRDVIKDAVDFMERHAKDEKVGFGHSPINWAGQHEGAKKHLLAPKNQCYHGWNWAGYRHEESRMSWKFMPWICRREWYLETLRGYGCLADKFVGWGGAELLQQVKALMLGYENWAIPGSPVIHIGPYGSLDRSASGYRYRTYSKSGRYPPGTGSLAAFYVLLGDEEGYKHCRENLNRRHVARYGVEINPKSWAFAREVGHEEHEWLRERRVMTYHELLERKPWEIA